MSLVLTGHFFSREEELIWLGDHGPHFNSLTVFKARPASGYLYSLLETVRSNKKETRDCFLGFYKRPVRHWVPARPHFL
jgi:hypothetical protein